MVADCLERFPRFGRGPGKDKALPEERGGFGVRAVCFRSKTSTPSSVLKAQDSDTTRRSLDPAVLILKQNDQATEGRQL